ncbi:zinc finger CCCH domain-containing protein 19 [Tanacetum coccineum]|uniref:Zinc finger CCCH domain-containing protein 19 n=1 Tax=Tanacetum coccineum TaxID=301880 RepID=A0ABQ5DUE6_9ASTR
MMIRSCITMGVLRLHEKNLEDDAGENLGEQSQGDIVTKRSWKDYFPSDLQIWSYYDNVKEAILLHNALSRQTKDAG